MAAPYANNPARTVASDLHGGGPDRHLDAICLDALNKIHSAAIPSEGLPLFGNLHQKEVRMRYTKPSITKTIPAQKLIQGDKNGMPADSNGIDDRTVGAGYPADE
jgi:hypothetical protein